MMEILMVTCIDEMVVRYDEGLSWCIKLYVRMMWCLRE